MKKVVFMPLFSNQSSDHESTDSKPEGFLEICRDGTTAEWRVQDGRVVRADLPDLACTPPDLCEHTHDTVRLTVSITARGIKIILTDLTD